MMADEVLESKESRDEAAAKEKLLSSNQSITTDIMMLLDTTKILTLQQEFDRAEDGLTISDFVFVMKRFLKSALRANQDSMMAPNSNFDNDTELVSNLCELFAQIDINGDGTMEWEEFTTFIVEQGKGNSGHHRDSIQSYLPSSWEDTNQRAGFIDRTYYFPKMDSILTCEQGSKTLRVYNSKLEPTNTIRFSDGAALCAEHMKSANRLAISTSDLKLSIYEDHNLRLVGRFQTPSTQVSLTWADGCDRLYSGGVNSVIYSWDKHGKRKQKLGGVDKDGEKLLDSHKDAVYDLLHIPSLECLVSASMDTDIRLWDIATGRHKKVLRGHRKGVRSLAYSEDYRFLISAGFEYNAVVWNPYVNNLILRLHGHSSSLCNIEMVPNTPQFLTADTGGVVKIWDIRNFCCVQTISIDTRDVNDNGDVIHDFASIHSRKSFVASGKRFHLFQYDQLQNPSLADDLPVAVALYNPISMTFITVGGKEVKLWDARTGLMMKRFRNLSDADLTSLCLDDRNRKFIVGDHNGRVQCFDYLNGTAMKEFNYPEHGNKAHLKEISKLIYCDEHKCVISCSWDRSLCIHDEMDPDKGILLRKLTGGHNADVTCVAYSSSMSLLASGSSDTLLNVWDFEFGRHEGNCTGHVSGLTALEFADPYPALLSADSKGNIVMWGMRPGPSHLRCHVLLRLQNRASAIHPVSAVTVMSTSFKWEDDGTCPAAKTEERSKFHKLKHLTSTRSISKRGASNGRVSEFFLYTGDENGEIKVFDLLPLLRQLEEEHGLKPIETPVHCDNSRRNLRIDIKDFVEQEQPVSTGAKKQQKYEKTFNFGDKLPAIKTTKSALVRSWSAHSDAVSSLQIIDDPPSILTASFDRLVKVFSLEGGELGRLCQGAEKMSRHYRFKVNIDKVYQSKIEQAAEVIQDIQTRAEDSDPSDSDSDADFSSLPEIKNTLNSSHSKSSRGESFNSASYLNFDNIVDSEPSDSIRRTPRLKPIQPVCAGKGFSVTPRGRKLRERAKRSSLN